MNCLLNNEFSIIVAKDSDNPILLKLVLQGLTYEWQVDWTLLTHVNNETTTSQNSTHAHLETASKSTLKISGMNHSVRRTSINKAGAMDSGM